MLNLLVIYNPRPFSYYHQCCVIDVVSTGVGSLGVVINIVAFLSLPVLEFIGISEPLERLTGRKYGL